LGRVREHGLPRIEHGWQRLPIDLDQVERPAGRVQVDSGDRGDLFADVADLFSREDRLVLDEHAPHAPGGVGSGHHGADARQGPRAAGVESADAGVRIRAAHHGRVEHA